MPQDMFYHGSWRMSEEAVRDTIDNGLRPGNPVDAPRTAYMAPIAGRTYLTRDLREAVIYALGGIVMGTERKESGYGYLFVVLSRDIFDPWPDEDEVGEAAAAGVFFDPKKRRYVFDTSKAAKAMVAHGIDDMIAWNVACAASRYLVGHPERIRRLDMGFPHIAQIGKAIVKEMNPEFRRKVAWTLRNLSHEGRIPIYEVWRVLRSDAIRIAPDASNFFDVARLWWRRGVSGSVESEKRETSAILA